MIFHLNEVIRLGKFPHFLKEVFFKILLKPILTCHKNYYHPVLQKCMLYSALISKEKNKGKDGEIWK